MRRAVVLLSGGLDSATTLAVARAQGFAVHALSVDYGQRHRLELERAERVAKALGAIEHKTVRLLVSKGANANPTVDVSSSTPGPSARRPGTVALLASANAGDLEMVRFFIEARTWDAADPAAVLCQTNALLRRRLPGTTFVPVVMAVIDGTTIRW